METKIIVIPENQLEDLLLKTFDKIEKRRAAESSERMQFETLYSVNKVAHRLGKAHATIKKLIKEGILETTPDGLISEYSINKYLRKS